MVFWWLYHLLRRRREQVEELVPPKLTKEEIDQYINQTLIEEAHRELDRRAREAMEELRKRVEEEGDPALEAMFKKLENHYKDWKDEEKGLWATYAVNIIALNEALKQGLHKKDREALYQYLLKQAYDIAKNIREQLIPTPLNEEFRINYENKWEITNPLRALLYAADLVGRAEEHDPVAKKYWDAISPLLDEAEKRIAERLGLTNPNDAYDLEGQLHPELAEVLEQTIKEYEEAGKLPRFWHKTPEEILGVEVDETRKLELLVASGDTGRVLLLILERLGRLEKSVARVEEAVEKILSNIENCKGWPTLGARNPRHAG